MFPKKNEERKKYAVSTLPVRVQLTPEVMVYRISIPLSILSYVVKLPIQLFLSSPIDSLDCLHLRLNEKALPPSWRMLHPTSDTLFLCKMTYHACAAPTLQFVLTIHDSLTWKISLSGRHIPTETLSMLRLPRTNKTITDLTTLLKFFNNCKICTGNS